MLVSEAVTVSGANTVHSIVPSGPLESEILWETGCAVSTEMEDALIPNFLMPFPIRSAMPGIPSRGIAISVAAPNVNLHPGFPARKSAREIALRSGTNGLLVSNARITSLRTQSRGSRWDQRT